MIRFKGFLQDSSAQLAVSAHQGAQVVLCPGARCLRFVGPEIARTVAAARPLCDAEPATTCEVWKFKKTGERIGSGLVVCRNQLNKSMPQMITDMATIEALRVFFYSLAPEPQNDCLMAAGISQYRSHPDGGGMGWFCTVA